MKINVNSVGLHSQFEDLKYRLLPCKGLAGADPGFQVRWGGALKKIGRAEGGAKIVGVFRVKIHDFTPKNHIFSQY